MCQDAETESGFGTAVMLQMGFRSGVAVPVTTSSGVWGTVIVFGERPGVFGAEEIAFLSAFAAVLLLSRVVTMARSGVRPGVRRAGMRAAHGP
ncbi:GAF domain-containing protein [Rhodococcus sp. MEB041]|uniref:GAF domain-containing protein n=1 Tax=Rhodococcus sp. MEB041 TaxID=3040323 RepID=UPI0025505C16|nr:GAF domain-containing protein [Rhodococcus sp. MEB041]